MNTFVNGAIMMEFIVAAAFFLRYWRRTGDQLFLMFALAFGLMACNRIVTGCFSDHGHDGDERQAWIYGVRLLAFVLILAGILIKNRRSPSVMPGKTV